MFCCPILAISFWIALESFDASLAAAYNEMLRLGVFSFMAQYGPKPAVPATVGYLIWIVTQTLFYQFLPSKLSCGQLTPAGNLLKYRTNGLLAWIVTHSLFAGLAVTGYLDPAIIARHWEGLLCMANVFGFAVPVVAYVKAHVAPTHASDRKFSGMLGFSSFADKANRFRLSTIRLLHGYVFSRFPRPPKLGAEMRRHAPQSFDSD